MEQEIRKHLHHILAEVVNRKKSPWKKFGEIIVEMIIIFLLFHWQPSWNGNGNRVMNKRR